MKDMKAAHKESMDQFKNKVEAEQKAQIDDLRRQMDNDKEEVSHQNQNKINVSSNMLWKGYNLSSKIEWWHKIL